MSETEVVPAMEKVIPFRIWLVSVTVTLIFMMAWLSGARIKDGVRLFTGCCGGSRVQGGSAGQAQGQGAHAGFKGTVHVLLRDGGC